MKGEQPRNRTAPRPTYTLPLTARAAGNSGVAVGSPGLVASSRAPGLTVTLPVTTMLPVGMKHVPVTVTELYVPAGMLPLAHVKAVPADDALARPAVAT